jgi:hypothetical protein
MTKVLQEAIPKGEAKRYPTAAQTIDEEKHVERLQRCRKIELCGYRLYGECKK